MKYLKTSAAKREIDLHPDVAEFLQRYMSGKSGLLLSSGGREGIRTPDPLLAKQVLSQLSYTPTKESHSF